MPKIIPFGDRLLVRRRKVGEKVGKEGILVAPDIVKERNTDLADVVYVPDLTFSDKHILDNADEIIRALTDKAIKGDDQALIALLRINEFVKMKTIKVGDAVFISKYVGTNFTEDDPQSELTLVKESDILGLIAKDEE